MTHVPDVCVSAPEVRLSAPCEENVAVITFGTVPSMVTRLSVEAKYAYLALCACALDKCRFSLAPAGGGGNEGEIDADENEDDYVTMQFHRDVLRDMIHHVGLTLDEVWPSLSAIMTGKGGAVTYAPFIEILKKEVMETSGGGAAGTTRGPSSVNDAAINNASSFKNDSSYNSYPVLSITSNDRCSDLNPNLSLPLQLNSQQQKAPYSQQQDSISGQKLSSHNPSSQNIQPQQQLQSNDWQHQPPQQSSSLVVPQSHGSASSVPLSPIHNSKNFCLLFFIQDLLTLAIQDANGYDARWRVFIKEFTLLLHVNSDFVDDIEESYIQYLRHKGKEGVSAANAEADEAAKDRLFRRKATRYLKIGLATAIGGTLVGMTGGLAAPFIAAGTGAIIGTAGAAVIGSGAGAAIIGSAFGVGGAGLIGFRMKRRVGGLEQFEFEPLFMDRFGCGAGAVGGVGSGGGAIDGVESLHVGIAISGWLNTDADDSFKLPWVNLMLSKEQYALKWEGKYLLELGQSLEYLLHVAMQKAGIEALKYTVLSGVMSAVAWPVGILALSHAIDNPWSVCMNRSTLAGKQLAHVLLAREHGKRPVSLIGFSLGARVIYACLEELWLLSRHGVKGRNGRSRLSHEDPHDPNGPFGIVENVVILGAPLPGDAASWRDVTKMVAGRVINGYCRSDWMLKFLYRTSSGNKTIAGLRPIEADVSSSSSSSAYSNKILNFDLTDIVSGHTDYAEKVGEILKTLGLETNWTAILSRSNSSFSRRSSVISVQLDSTSGSTHSHLNPHSASSHSTSPRQGSSPQPSLNGQPSPASSNHHSPFHHIPAVDSNSMQLQQLSSHSTGDQSMLHPDHSLGVNSLRRDLRYGSSEQLSSLTESGNNHNPAQPTSFGDDQSLTLQPQEQQQPQQQHLQQQQHPRYQSHPHQSPHRHREYYPQQQLHDLPQDQSYHDRNLYSDHQSSHSDHQSMRTSSHATGTASHGSPSRNFHPSTKSAEDRSNYESTPTQIPGDYHFENNPSQAHGHANQLSTRQTDSRGSVHRRRAESPRATGSSSPLRQRAYIDPNGAAYSTDQRGATDFSHSSAYSANQHVTDFPHQYGVANQPQNSSLNRGYPEVEECVDALEYLNIS